MPDDGWGSPDPGIRPAPLVPRVFADTPAMLALRAAERFGAGGGPSGPVGWWEGLDPGQQATLIGYELIRRAEEHRAAAAAMVRR